MPEFLGRPNVPNQLANTLVQLAAQQQDPLAAGFKAIGGLADNYTEYQTKLKLLGEAAKIEEEKAQKQHGRAVELKKMDTDAAIFSHLLSNDRIIDGLLGAGDKGPSRADAAALLSGAKTPEEKPAQEGVPLSRFGIKIPGDPRVVSGKDKVKVDDETAKRFGLPSAAIGKSLTMEQVVNLRRSEGRSAGAGARDPRLEAQAVNMVMKDPAMMDATMEEKLAAIDDAYDGLVKIKSGGDVPQPAPKPAPEKKPGIMEQVGSVFGFGQKKPASAAAPAPASSEEEAVRSEYQSGKITKEVARQKIQAIRAKKK